MIVYNYPQTPDRINSINAQGINCADTLAKIARKLESWDADFLVMPSNTAHYYEKNLCQYSYSLLKQTSCYIERNGIKRVGLLATDPTLNTRIYEKT